MEVQPTISQNKAVRGKLFYLTDDPFLNSPEDCAVYEPDGLLICEGGEIKSVGSYSSLKGEVSDGTVIEHYPEYIIIPGFIDAHIHYPQAEVIGSYGEQLLQWLQKYTFPTEGRFLDRETADRIAEFFIAELLRNGTTTASVFCTVHPHSADALFAAASQVNMRISGGKVMMDRNAPDYLLDTAQSSYDDTKALIDRWHNQGRAIYCVTPRFAITSTPEQLVMAADLFHQHDGVLLQSHISENLSEITYVHELFPERKSYADVYHHYGLLGERAIYGHAVHFTEDDYQLFYETGSSISHCPTSNLFIGSGLFDLQQAKRADRPIRVGLATDVGGGTSYSMLQTLGEAYKVAQLQGYSMSAIHGFYLATLGSARSLHLDDRIGTFAPGYEADFVVLDPGATPLLQLRTSITESIEELLFVLMTIGDDRAVKATYVAGEKVYQRTI